MKTIDIQTTHNVIIEKGLASVGIRIAAYLLDVVFLVISILLFLFIFSLFGNSTLTAFVASLFLFFFNLLIEIANNGQSFGKKILGIKIIRLDGKELTFSDLFSRWSVRFIDIYMSLGTIAFLTISTSLNGQRLGDRMANTVVVQKKDRSYFSLSEITKLKNAKDYKTIYPTVTRLDDKDVLLIKKTLQRNFKYPSENNKRALILLSDKVEQVLGLDNSSQDKVRFLQTIMRDYIALTR